MESSVLDVVAKDLPEFHSILNNLKTYLSESTIGVSLLHEMISTSGTKRDEGLSFLEMKCHLYLEYLINIAYSMLLKIDGKQIAGQQCIENLVEIRTVLTKIRPIEKKLKYQIDKFVKMASTEFKSADQDALSYKPNVDNLVGKDDESNSESEGNVEEKKDVYVPPKVTSVPYDGDKLSREEKKLEKARQRSLNSNLLADMRQELGDEPDEISDVRNRGKQAKYRKKEDEREVFEESNLRRLTLSKKDKTMTRKLNALDEVVKIGNFGSFNDDNESDDDDDKFTPKYKKKKGKKFEAGKGKKFKKRMQRYKK